MAIEKIRSGYYLIHIDTSESWLKFEVYPVVDWSGPGNKSGTSYIDLETEPDTREVFEKGKCLMKMAGSYCYRGVWEGRLYFTDREYWSEELKELSSLFYDVIEPWCKTFIRKINPYEIPE